MLNSGKIEAYKYMPKPDTPEYISKYLQKVFEHILKMQHQQCQSSILFNDDRKKVGEFNPVYSNPEFTGRL